ncbi:MAG TPA: outer membrane beta-barrel protein, partial [Casimicrobiaceae bacterium]|nr:outer membrane beta-barrel protein [Casimicrobiaceae bacterium]
IEAAFARSESYALRPFSTSVPTGVGLALGGREIAPQASYNLDLYGSYTFLRSFALYGRVGYAQGDPSGIGSSALVAASDAKLPRDGMNYGLGLRYDISRALGVNLEYSRFGRFAFDSFGSTLPDSDQVRLGVQFRF